VSKGEGSEVKEPKLVQPMYRQAHMTTIRVVEIAELLGVSKQRAHQIVDEEGFPAPVDREGQSRLWGRREVETWAKAWRREKGWR
jgi:predicted DNA-binding transcriptional regulator AlpA